MYLYTAVSSSPRGHLGEVIPTELFSPGIAPSVEDQYNHCSRMHGTIMLFLSPHAGHGVRQHHGPLQIGAPDVAFLGSHVRLLLFLSR
jgi:heme/copper-type cytochrome/quinol oxidase subunit 1